MSAVQKEYPSHPRRGRGIVIVRILVLIILVACYVAMVDNGVAPDVALAAIAALTSIALKLADKAVTSLG